MITGLLYIMGRYMRRGPTKFVWVDYNALKMRYPYNESWFGVWPQRILVWPARRAANAELDAVHFYWTQP